MNKRYTNTTQAMVTIVFETFTQFFKRGQSVVTSEEVKKMPNEGVLVEEVNAPKKNKTNG